MVVHFRQHKQNEQVSTEGDALVCHVLKVMCELSLWLELTHIREWRRQRRDEKQMGVY